MVGGTIRRKVIHRESFRASVLHPSEIQAVLQSIAEKKCLLTRPSLLSRGTLTLPTLHPNEMQQWYPLFACRRQEKTKTSAWATRPTRPVAGREPKMQKTFYVACLLAMCSLAAKSPTQSAATQTDLKATSLCVLQKQVVEGKHET